MTRLRKALVLGGTVDWSGDVTQNQWVSARSARGLEKSLGFAEGRLSAGWWILVLKQKLTPQDFIFAGLTLRSGGRYGKPADTPEEDDTRLHVHCDMLRKYGAAELDRMKRKALVDIAYTGPRRLVKVVAVTRHSMTEAPSKQYPMGGGGLQWTLRRDCEFFVAVRVDAHGNALTPNFSVFLGESAAYADRDRLARYIETA